MRRSFSQMLNAVWEDKENISELNEEDGEACSMAVSNQEKIGTVDVSKATKLSEMQNVSTKSQKKFVQKASMISDTYVLRESDQRSNNNSYQLIGNLSDSLKGNQSVEPTIPCMTLSKWDSPSKSGPTSVGNANYLTLTEVNTISGPSEKRTQKPVDFATVTVADFNITPESFTKQSTGQAKSSLKFRRRSTIGVRGSPENNTLIRYLAEQKRNRQEDHLKQQGSPFDRQHVGSLKDRIHTFQSAFQSVQEDEGKDCLSGLLQEERESQTVCHSQDKSPFLKRNEWAQLNGELTSECKKIAYKESLKQDLCNSDKTFLGIQRCSIVSPPVEASVTVTTATISTETAYAPPNITESACLSLKAIPSGNILKIVQEDFSSGGSSENFRSNTTLQLRGKRVKFAEELSLQIFDKTMSPVTPLQKGNISTIEQSQSGSSLRSVLKKTPIKHLMESVKENLSSCTGEKGTVSPLASSPSTSCEALQTDQTELDSSEKPAKRKKVTFGRDLSPEIFDETLPANTPLRRGAMPASQLGSQSSSPPRAVGTIKEPLSQPNFDDSDDEYVKPPQELIKNFSMTDTSLHAKDVEETDTKISCKRPTRSCTKGKYINISEETDFSIFTGKRTKKTKDTKNPRNCKGQGSNTSASRKTLKVKDPGSGKRRRRRKVQKSLYGEREIASKKPLLSPIPEILEVISSSSSSPKTPQANTVLFSDDPENSCDHIESVNEAMKRRKTVGRRRRKNVSITNKCPDSKELVEASSSSDTETQSLDCNLFSVSSNHTEVDSVSENTEAENKPESPFMLLDQKESTICEGNWISEEGNKSTCEWCESSVTRRHVLPVVKKSYSPLKLPNTNIQEGKHISLFGKPDNTQQEEDTVCAQPEKEQDGLLGNKCVLESENPSNNSETLALSVPVNIQDMDVKKDIKKMECLTEESGRQIDINNVNFKRFPKRGKRSTVYLPGVANLDFETTGKNLSGSSSNMQEVLSTSHVESNSETFNDLHKAIEESFRRISETCDENRSVRRSMRLHKDAEHEGLAWIHIPNKLDKTSSLSVSACKTRRASSVSMLKESENVHQSQENWNQYSAPGKENHEYVPLAGGAHKMRRRRSMCVSTLLETRKVSQTQKKRRASLVSRNDKSHQKNSEGEKAVENQMTT
ncbi:cell division cycle-associated protein 2 isoform X1 [Alligator mississippiensis]|uniref:cell division cycle-associated protein 2 isoform X1 n=1 Tax=Alligator mississippiensis TaxID=8496 RepID=UPI0028779A89|nr:cell division cycle-associated protein 2 isoform X1 [Alligator mississippiensis]XP_019337993.2 cell division cycle-associated protein 2 isoform X1 [Alligator mississippiensis]XP_019337994.2 cell division cycle-associated protein 2 isoform X1 [Alligator mississippiensis]XP_019337995.2 cell division cycle-associated protein 2 isoform X1 [Alligator mississippiensis]XP_019337996.2 cell division cycle-associated protein 2 isoform X1 [Alligator mississippiensis]XP_059586716.1 cell division cycle-